MTILYEDIDYNILDMGYDRHLVKGFDYEAPPEMAHAFTQGVTPGIITSGEMNAKVSSVEGYLQSSNFISGSEGWKIDAEGNFEANVGTFRGDLFIGSGDNIILADPNDATWRLGIGNADIASAPFRVDKDGNLTATSATISGYVVEDKRSFGGDGTDGALSITSGITTIDLGSSRYFIRNYTSISITGTGQLAFINPNNNGTIITLKSQGDVIITSSGTPTIDLRSIGAAATTNGTSTFFSVVGGGAGGSGSATDPGAGGSSAAVFLSINGKFIPIAAGGGGGTAGGGGDTGGVGGRGGGGFLIECAGALNFGSSSDIDLSGANGNDGSDGNRAGGGGGGGGGILIILYHTLITNSGTLTSTGGTGGTDQGANNGGGTGGTGVSIGGGIAKGGDGGTTIDVDAGQGGGGGAGGGGGNNGSSGTGSSTTNGTGGGGGGGGAWLIIENIEFL